MEWPSVSRPHVAALVLLSLLLIAAAPPPARVMSLNACADQYVLALLPPSRIASVTWLARDPAVSSYAAAAAAVPTNHGTAEEVAAQHPDLVVTLRDSAPGTTTLLRRLHIRVLELDADTDFAAIRATTRRLGAVFGVPARADQLLARMTARLARLPAGTPPIRVAAWNGDGSAPGPHTLYTAVLTAAGAADISPGHRALDTETLLALSPALLVQATGGGHAPSLREAAAQQTLIRTRWRGRILRLPQAAITCGSPATADAASDLHDQLGHTATAAAPP